MNDIERLQEALGRDPERGTEITGTLLRLLAEADEEVRLLVLVKLREAESEANRLAVREGRLSLRAPEPVTDAERIVKEIVLESGSLLTADDIVQSAPAYPRSLHHRSGASAVLNSLVNKGELGKLTIGRETYFSSVREIVQQAQIAWMREHPGEPPEKTSPTAIASMTGLSSAQVIRALSELMGDC